MTLSFSLGLGLTTLRQGGGVVKTLNVLRDSRIMRNNLRMTDNG